MNREGRQSDQSEDKTDKENNDDDDIDGGEMMPIPDGLMVWKRIKKVCLLWALTSFFLAWLLYMWEMILRK